MELDVTTTVDLCKMIAEKVNNPPTHVAAISRGGLIAGLTLSKHWDVPLVPIHNNDSRKSLIEVTKILNSGDHVHVLIVDDYCVTGYTMSNITNYLFRYSDPNKVTTAVVCSPKSASDLVDICGMVVEDGQKIKVLTEFTF